MIITITLIASIDISFKVATLVYMQRNASVRSLTFRDWVLLVAFVPLAWIFYFVFGKGNKK